MNGRRWEQQLPRWRAQSTHLRLLVLPVVSVRSYVTLDGLRGVAALCIVGLHAHRYFGDPLPSAQMVVDLFFVSMTAGWLSSAVGLLAVRGRERFGGGEQRSSLYRLFNVEDRAKWEARSGGAFPKRAVRRLDENGRLPERRAHCG